MDGKDKFISHDLLSTKEECLTEQDVDSDHGSVDSIQLLADIADAINSYTDDTEVNFFTSGETKNAREHSQLKDKEISKRKSSNDSSIRPEKAPIVSVEDLIKSSDQPNSSCESLKNEYSHLAISLKDPVIRLTKLDPGMEVCKVKTLKKDNSGTYSFSLEPVGDRKARKRTEVKKSSWYEENSPASEISVSDVSDPEEITVKQSDSQSVSGATNVKASGQKSSSNITKPKEEGMISKVQEKIVKQPSGHHKQSDKDISLEKNKGKNSLANMAKSTTSHSTSKSLTHKTNPNSASGSKVSDNSNKSKNVGIHTKITGKETTSTEKPKIPPSVSRKRKLSKDDADSEMIEALSHSSDKVQKVTSTSSENKKPGDLHLRQTDWCYELQLSSFGIEDLSSDNFRKFINLASDCGFNYDSPLSNGRCRGHVRLYFGCISSMQTGMQKLSQVSLASPKILHGTIFCRHIKPDGKSEASVKWRVAEEVKLGFSMFSTWTEKLKQLVQAKEWKRDGETKRKCAQIQRIPPFVSTEMLSLLFPFSLNVHTPKPNTRVHKKGYTEIEFENSTWMETILSCFRDFYAIRKGSGDPVWRLSFENFKPPFEKMPDPPPIKALQARSTSKDSNNPKTPAGSTSKETFKGRNAESYGKRHSDNYHTLIKDTPSARGKNECRKRPYSASDDLTPKAVTSEKKGKIVEKTPNPESFDKRDKSTPPSNDKDALKTLAQSKGLDPNNADVIRILEMQNQLISLQSLFSCDQLEDSANLHGQTSHQGNRTNKSETRKGRYTTEINSAILEAEKQLRDNIAMKQQQLKELELKLQNKKSVQKSAVGNSAFSSTSQMHTVNTLNQMEVPEFIVPPSRNDAPLDFTKPAPKVEEAVKEDEKRSKMLAVKTSASHSTPKVLKGKKDNFKQSSINVEDFALPLQFGKNVKKATSDVLASDSKTLRKSNGKQVSDESRRGVRHGRNSDWELEHKKNNQNRNQFQRMTEDQRDRELQMRETNLGARQLNRPFHSLGSNMVEKGRNFDLDTKRPESKQWDRNPQQNALLPMPDMMKGSNVQNQARDQEKEIINTSRHGERKWEKIESLSMPPNRPHIQSLDRGCFGQERFFKTEQGTATLSDFSSGKNQMNCNNFAGEIHRRDLTREMSQTEQFRQRDPVSGWQSSSSFENLWNENTDYNSKQFTESNRLRSGPERDGLQAKESGFKFGNRRIDSAERPDFNRNDSKPQSWPARNIKDGRDVMMDHSRNIGNQRRLQDDLHITREDSQSRRSLDHAEDSLRNRGMSPRELYRPELQQEKARRHPSPWGGESRFEEVQAHGYHEEHQDRGFDSNYRGNISEAWERFEDKFDESYSESNLQGILPKAKTEIPGTLSGRVSGMRGRGIEPQRGNGMRGRGRIERNFKPHGDPTLDERDMESAQRGQGIRGQGIELQRGQGVESQRGVGMRGRGVEHVRNVGLDERDMGLQGGIGMRGRDMEIQRGTGMRGRGMEAQRGTGIRGRGMEAQRGTGIQGRDMEALRGIGMQGRGIEPQRNIGMQERGMEPERGFGMLGKSMEPQRNIGMQEKGLELQRNIGMQERDIELKGGFGMRGRGMEPQRDIGMRGRGMEIQRNIGMHERDMEPEGGIGMRERGIEPQRDIGMRGRGMEIQKNIGMHERDMEPEGGIGMRERGIEPQRNIGMQKREIEPKGGTGMRGRGLEPQRGIGMRGRGMDSQRGNGMLGRDMESQRVIGFDESYMKPLGNTEMSDRRAQLQRKSEIEDFSEQSGTGFRGRGMGLLGRGTGMRGRGMESHRGVGMRERGSGLSGKDMESHKSFELIEKDLEIQGGTFMGGRNNIQRGVGMRGRDVQSPRDNGMRGRGADLQRGPGIIERGSGMREETRERGTGLRGRGTSHSPLNAGLAFQGNLEFQQQTQLQTNNNMGLNRSAINTNLFLQRGHEGVGGIGSRGDYRGRGNSILGQAMGVSRGAPLSNNFGGRGQKRGSMTRR